MEIIESKEGLKSVLTVQLTDSDYRPAVEKELKKAKQTAQLKGFRQGSVPMSIIKKKYEFSLCFDIVGKLVAESVENYFKDDPRPLLGQVLPLEDYNDVSVLEAKLENKNMDFMFEAGFFAELAYQTDKNTELTFYNIIVDDDEVETELNYMLRKAGSFIRVDNIGEQDFVYASFELDKPLAAEIEANASAENVETAETVDDVETAENGETVEIVGDVETVETAVSETDNKQKRYITFLYSKVDDQYKSLFFDVAVNSEVRIDVKLENIFTNKTDLLSMLNMSQEEYDALPDSLTLTIDAVTRIIPAEPDQEFFDTIAPPNQIHNRDEALEYLRNNKLNYYERVALYQMAMDFKLYIEDTVDIDLPQDFLRKQIDYANKNKRNENGHVQEPQEVTDEEFNEYFYSIRWQFVLDTLLSRANIELSQDDLLVELKHRIAELSDYYRAYNIGVEQIKDMVLSDENEIAMLKTQAKEMLLAKLLKETATITTIDASYPEFEKAVREKVEKIRAEAEVEVAKIEAELAENEAKLAENEAKLAEIRAEMKASGMSDEQIAAFEEAIMEEEEELSEAGIAEFEAKIAELKAKHRAGLKASGVSEEQIVALEEADDETAEKMIDEMIEKVKRYEESQTEE